MQTVTHSNRFLNHKENQSVDQSKYTNKRSLHENETLTTDVEQKHEIGNIAYFYFLEYLKKL